MLEVDAFKGFFFQAEDGIRDAQESRGLGDVYKRQIESQPKESVSLALYDQKIISTQE